MVCFLVEVFGLGLVVWLDLAWVWIQGLNLIGLLRLCFIGKFCRRFGVVVNRIDSVIPTRLGLDVVRDDSEKEVKCWIRGGDD
jgi:hypothetical protein